MTPDAIYTAVVGVIFLVAGIEIGLAFLMRGEREAGSERDS